LLILLLLGCMILITIFYVIVLGQCLLFKIAIIARRIFFMAHFYGIAYKVICICICISICICVCFYIYINIILASYTELSNYGALYWFGMRLC